MLTEAGASSSERSARVARMTTLAGSATVRPPNAAVAHAPTAAQWDGACSPDEAGASCGERWCSAVACPIAAGATAALDVS